MPFRDRDRQVQIKVVQLSSRSLGENRDSKIDIEIWDSADLPAYGPEYISWRVQHEADWGVGISLNKPARMVDQSLTPGYNVLVRF